MHLFCTLRHQEQLTPRAGWHASLRNSTQLSNRSRCARMDAVIDGGAEHILSLAAVQNKTILHMLTICYRRSIGHTLCQKAPLVHE
jgi:hypothetical protein